MYKPHDHLPSHRPIITIGAAIGCSLAIALALAAILYVAAVSHSNQNKNCDAALQVRDALVTIVKDAQRLDPTGGSTSFYSDSISTLRKVNCRS